MVEANELIPVIEEVKDTEQLLIDRFGENHIMIKIASCESSLEHLKEDGTVITGHVDKDDTGLFQINLRFHQETAESMGLNVFEVNDNIAYASYLYETQGTKPWNASKSCWNK